MMNEPYKRAPIHAIAKAQQVQFDLAGGWPLPRDFGDAAQEVEQARQASGLLDESAQGKIQVEGQAAGELLEAAGLAVGQGALLGSQLCFRLRRDRFLLKLSPGAAPEVAASLAEKAAGGPDLITVTDMTHGYAELRLVGPASGTLLSRLCGLDFGEAAFPNLHVRQSSVAKTAQIILRQDLGSYLSFSLVGSRSLAAYLWQTLLAAGRDLGIGPMGQAARSMLQSQN